jgi:hypothetical protein
MALCLVLLIACAGAAFSLASAWRDARAAAAPVARGSIEVEVLNGCGRKGAAAEVAERLRSLGFDVVAIGNADDFDHAETVVIDRSGSSAGVTQVAEALGCPRRGRDLRDGALVDVSVVLGADFAGLPGLARDSGDAHEEGGRPAAP